MLDMPVGKFVNKKESSSIIMETYYFQEVKNRTALPTKIAQVSNCVLFMYSITNKFDVK